MVPACSAHAVPPLVPRRALHTGAKGFKAINRRDDANNVSGVISVTHYCWCRNTLAGDFAAECNLSCFCELHLVAKMVFIDIK
jgi:hypothetical protein